MSDQNRRQSGRRGFDKTNSMPLGCVLAAFAFLAMQSAHAQSLNSDWSLGGGTGIGRHATGFSGTLGDPEHMRATPATERVYPPGYGRPGGSWTAPVSPAYAPPGAPLEYYTPAKGR